jgi:threonylcarbamoyladenosine tRNA methylthiotransferase MtaB
MLTSHSPEVALPTAGGGQMPPSEIPDKIRRRAAFRTIGCKLNQCETAQMQETLRASGYDLVDWDAPADVRVLNTCTVTAKSDRTCRREIRLARRRDPDCVVAVTGCYAQVAPETIAAIPGVDLVLGNTEKLNLAGYLDRLRCSGHLPLTAVGAHPAEPDFDREFITHFYGYTRAFLKVQTGCDSSCSYCVIPIARGPARSMPRADVLEQARLLTGEGYREVVLTGINLGSWGRDTGEARLPDLLGALVDESNVSRYRLSSIEPLEVDTLLLDAVERGGERVAHHFHLPLQSGADSVLARMNRPYCSGQYVAIVNEVRARFPRASIGADVIVGFPGETEADFAQTYDLIERLPLTYLHVFSYSDRPGTPASRMRDKVNPETIRQRNSKLRDLGAVKNEAFLENLLTCRLRALILRERTEEGLLVCLTDNYVEVLLEGDDSLMNRFAEVELGHPMGEGRCNGTLLRVEAAV